MTELVMVNNSNEVNNTVIRSKKMFDKVYNWGKVRVNDVQKNIAKSRFESQIQEIIKIANSHKSKGVELGSDVYGHLYDRATALVEAYCDKWGGNASDVINNAPALAELHSWAVYNKQQDYAGKAKMFLFAGIGSAIAAGAWVGIFHVTSHAFTFWIR